MEGTQASSFEAPIRTRILPKSNLRLFPKIFVQITLTNLDILQFNP